MVEHENIYTNPIDIPVSRLCGGKAWKNLGDILGIYVVVLGEKKALYYSMSFPFNNDNI